MATARRFSRRNLSGGRRRKEACVKNSKAMRTRQKSEQLRINPYTSQRMTCMQLLFMFCPSSIVCWRDKPCQDRYCMLLSSSSICKRQDGWIRIWDDNICSNLAVNGEVASRNIEIPSAHPRHLVNSGFHIYRLRMLQWCATTSILLQMWQPVPRKSYQVGHSG